MEELTVNSCPHCSHPLRFENKHDELIDLLKEFRLNVDFMGEDFWRKYLENIESFYFCDNPICKLRKDGGYRGEFPCLTYSLERPKLKQNNEEARALYKRRVLTAKNYFLSSVQKVVEILPSEIVSIFVSALKLIWIPDPTIISFRIMDTDTWKSQILVPFSFKKEGIKDYDKIVIEDGYYQNNTELVRNGVGIKDLTNNSREKLANLVKHSPIGLFKIKSLMIFKLIVETNSNFGLFVEVLLPYNRTTLKDQGVEEIFKTREFLEIEPYIRKIKLEDIFKLSNEISSNIETLNNSEFTQKTMDFIYQSGIGLLLENFYKVVKSNGFADRQVYIILRIVDESENHVKECFKFFLPNGKKQRIFEETRRDEENSFLDFDSYWAALKNWNHPPAGIIGITRQTYVPEFLVCGWADPRFYTSPETIMAERLFYFKPMDYICIPLVIRGCFIGAVMIQERVGKNSKKQIFDNEQFLYRCISLLSLASGLRFDIEECLFTEFICDATESALMSTDSKNRLENLGRMFQFLPKIDKSSKISFRIGTNNQNKPTVMKVIENFMNIVIKDVKSSVMKRNDIWENIEPENNQTIMKFDVGNGEITFHYGDGNQQIIKLKKNRQNDNVFEIIQDCKDNNSHISNFSGQPNERKRFNNFILNETKGKIRELILKIQGKQYKINISKLMRQ